MTLQLTVIEGLHSQRMLTFLAGQVMIGRGPECHLRLQSELVSRQHCLLSIRPGAVMLRDLGSTNGTLINGHPLQGEIRLRAGDNIQLAPWLLRIEG